MDKVLVVEDEPAMSTLLAQVLRESGFEVTVAGNGRDGLKEAPGQDLLIVDVMMPEMNGFQMVRQLRSSGRSVPVLFLTARDSPGDIVKGLDLGGDDYLVKPFRLVELLARVRALIRRSRDNRTELQFGDLWIDLNTRQVKRGDARIYLSNTEFALLELLARTPGQPVAKGTIMREVWNDTEERDDNLVEVYINYLRTKLEVGKLPRIIFTVRGKGYMLDEPSKEP